MRQCGSQFFREAGILLPALAFLVAAGPAQAQNPQQSIQEDYQTAGRAMREGRLREAETAFRHVLSLAPNDVGAHGNLGVIYMRERKWTEALTELEIARKLAPQVPGVRLNIGLAQFRQGNYREAIPPFESVLRDSPGSVPAR
ncbi:MAG TPA: tetratricopeptide repeat protein, partial [Bryobacteraceae bacterium]|nr:tetratricopeptide repeat protein [Bryobacteraceae bacterium]